jgi:Domain of Unknown Function with PDB structure (DUF3857)
MKSFFVDRLFCTLVLCCAFLSIGTDVFGQDKDWRPVTPAELAAKTPLVEPEADSEAIFWEVRVDDSSVNELALRHYVRVKIFTERGREQFSRHDVVFTKGTKVKDVEARVTKPDGSSVFLKKEDVLEREILKASGFKVKAKTFALPGLEIGSIVEYRYKEVVENAEANMRLIFQREVPIQTISYYVKPFAGERGLYYQPFNVGNTKFEKDKNGFHRATMTNVPAFREEPSMLPEDEVRSWIYIFYLAVARKSAEEYWKEIGKAHYDHIKETMKANDDVKRVTEATIAGAASDEDKLRKIFEYTKTQIRNLNYADKVSEEEWKKALNSKSPGDTLKLKMGSGSQIDNLFGAMARAAGFDAREAFSGSRSELFFDRTIANASLMLNSTSVAVKVGETWRFFSPAAYYSPFGMLSWAEEGQIALIADGKDAMWQEMKLSGSDKSREKRTGKFKILEDGTLEGEARIEYTGHWAASIKSQSRGDSASEQEKNLKDRIKASILGSTEVENFTIENVSDPEKPLVYTFKIRVPGYASRTGKRLFFQPNVFDRSSKPRFVSNTRKYDVYFNYPYSEQDELTIELPAGFALENADKPTPIKDAQGISSHSIEIVVADGGKTLVYKRNFSFGNGGFIRFPTKSYPAIKSLFEAFNKADIHQLTLREGAAASTTK